MKIIIIFLITYLVVFDSHGQSFLNQQKKITQRSKNVARKEFIKTWKQAEDVSLLSAYVKRTRMKFIPIPSFVLSKEAINYDSTKRLITYLIPNEKHPLEEAFVLSKRLGESDKPIFLGAVDCFDPVFHDDDSPCNFLDYEGLGPQQRDYSLKRTFDTLSSRNYSFLFSVRHIRNCIFFVEKGEVFLLDMNEFRIYDPDEYVRSKCSIQIIRELADGTGQICN